MSNTDQNLYPDEPAGPPDESGLLGEPNSPNNSGLVGTPNSPDNTGLVGSGQIDTAADYNAGQTADSTGLAGGAEGYGPGTDTTGAYSAGNASNTGTMDNTGGLSNTGMYGAPATGPSNTSNTSNTGTYGSGSGSSDIGETSAELPDQQLLQPGYNPPVGDAGRLQDIERGGPNPGGYSGAPGQPGIPDQAGTLDQTTYSNRNDDNAPAGPDADMRPNDTDERTGY